MTPLDQSYSPTPPPQIPRPASVTVMAILAIFFGLLGVFCTPFAFLPYFIDMGMPNPMVDAVKEHILLFGYMMLSLPIGCLMAAVLLAGGIGALGLRDWARKTLIVWAWVSLSFSVLGLLVTAIAFVPLAFEVAGNADPMMRGGIVGGAIGGTCGGLFSLLLPIAMLYIMTRPKVKAAFDAKSAQRSLL